MFVSRCREEIIRLRNEQSLSVSDNSVTSITEVNTTHCIDYW